MSSAAAFGYEPSAEPIPAEERARQLEDPGFGRVFTDHMALIRFSRDKGWHDARITGRRPLEMETATASVATASAVRTSVIHASVISGPPPAAPARIRRTGRRARRGA